MARQTKSSAANRPGGQALGPRLSSHLARVTALAAVALVAALCLPEVESHPEAVKPQETSSAAHADPSGTRSAD
ncbi:hypothetical protein [Streptomyces sp. UG1]|uniref:hypothetical protein n=1 Tax=Streptomyces sp. UG1 TaxID=3417652 RepID=UPI003CF9B354